MFGKEVMKQTLWFYYGLSKKGELIFMKSDIVRDDQSVGWYLIEFVVHWDASVEANAKQSKVKKVE